MMVMLEKTFRELVKKNQLNKKNYTILKGFCDKHKIDFTSTLFPLAKADLLNSLGVPFFKVVTMNKNNLRLFFWKCNTSIFSI